MINTGLVSGNAQNNSTDKAVRTRSKFNMSYNHLQTARFGEINSHFVMEVVSSDKIRLRSAHELRTFTLKAPLMQDIEIKKDYFSVPMEAILPLNWEKIYTNPTVGDDIDASRYGTSIEAFYSKVYNVLKKLWDYFFDQNNSDTNRVEALLRFCSIGNLFYSHGSLMSQLGYHYEAFLKYGYNWDKFVDYVYSTLEQNVADFGVLDNNNVVLFAVTTDDVLISEQEGYVSFRYFYDFIQNNSDWHLDSVVYTPFIDDMEAKFLVSDFAWTSDKSQSVNIARVLAYQLVCAHYYSNDSIDYIYSADLFRQYIFSLIDSSAYSISVPTWYKALEFTYNGVKTPVDYLSAAVFNAISAYFIANVSTVNNNSWLYFYQYLQAIFGFKNSLRYLDYFTGCKSRPLAVGNVDANVVGGKVSIIDVTRNIQIQKFLNSVNRTGRKFSNYIEGLFGNKVAYDYHNPAYIAHTSDKAVAYEVENTGTDQFSKQNSVTAIARSNASKFAFEFECDRPSIVIGVFYFDIARNYSLQVDKQIYHVDRFDMFNPYLQFIGDQIVNGKEINPNLPSSPFGYQLRYAEYKQRVNQLEGGFVDKLPGYAFDSSTKEFLSYGAKVIKPSFIRSHPWELDEFYLSLPYQSLDGYFHFIIKNNNDVEASRPMAFAPSIL